jgi:hypothetical protein
MSHGSLRPDHEKLFWEARARITWGDSRELVQQWLLEKGVNHSEADQILDDCLRERARSIRTRGMWDLAVGLPALAVSILGAIGANKAVDWLLDQGVRVPARAVGIIWAASGLAGIYAVNRLFRGVERTLLGARTAGADSDIED